MTDPSHIAAAHIPGLYDRTAREWDAVRRPALTLERDWLERFAALLLPDGAVLDLGCGTGDPLARALLARGCGVVGVDASPNMIALARQRFLSGRSRRVAGGDTTWAVPGFALLRDVDLADGVVEFNVHSASFPAVVFHAESPEEYESVYLRMDRSGHPDALQYSPVYRRFLPWRLYPDGQAAAALDTAGRTHVRLVLQGRTARVYVNGATTPNLVVALRHPARGGAIGVWNSSGTQRFSHFRHAALSRGVGRAADSVASGPIVPGALTRWALSPLLIGAALEAYPPPVPDSARGWRPIAADADGLVNISRYWSALVSEGRVTPVGARTVLTRERAGPARLAFGYCDRAVVFLNGRRVFAGTLPLRSGGDFPRMVPRDTVPLSLRAGRNELLVVTTGNTYGDRNGGWGFIARLVPDGAARTSAR